MASFFDDFTAPEESATPKKSSAGSDGFSSSSDESSDDEAILATFREKSGTLNDEISRRRGLNSALNDAETRLEKNETKLMIDTICRHTGHGV